MGTRDQVLLLNMHNWLELVRFPQSTRALGLGVVKVSVRKSWSLALWNEELLPLAQERWKQKETCCVFHKTHVYWKVINKRFVEFWSAFYLVSNSDLYLHLLSNEILGSYDVLFCNGAQLLLLEIYLRSDHVNQNTKIQYNGEIFSLKKNFFFCMVSGIKWLSYSK